MSTAIRIDTSDLDRLNRRLADFSRLDTRRLMNAVGAEVESQTRRRISDQKTAPDGTPWAPWSPDYAATRAAGASRLQDEGDLLDSIHPFIYLDGQAVEVGSNLVYAAIHQWGGAPVGSNIPARPYLGLSNENEADVQGVVDDWLDAHMRSTLQ